MKIRLMRHSCEKGSLANMMQYFMGETEIVDKCPFFWKMRDGKTYHGNVYYFTLFGIRLVINTTRKKEIWCR